MSSTQGTAHYSGAGTNVEMQINFFKAGKGSGLRKVYDLGFRGVGFGVYGSGFQDLGSAVRC